MGRVYASALGGVVNTTGSRQYASALGGVVNEAEAVTGDASAPGATLIGTGTLVGGVATGGAAGNAPGATLTATSVLIGGAATATNFGTFTTKPFVNNTGTAHANESGAILNIYNQTTGALVVQKTGVSTNAGGIATVTDVLIIPGTTYAYEIIFATVGRRLPVKAAT